MYTPNNASVYIAAFAGALAGMGVAERNITSKVFGGLQPSRQSSGGIRARIRHPMGGKHLQLIPVRSHPGGMRRNLGKSGIRGAIRRLVLLAIITTSRWLVPATYLSVCQALNCCHRAGSIYIVGQGGVPYRARSS